MSDSHPGRGAGTAPRHRFRPDIEGLRAVAVLPVLAYHVSPSVAPGGFVGVDVFFVISGYLISQLLCADIEQNKFSIVTDQGLSASVNANNCKTLVHEDSVVGDNAAGPVGATMTEAF